MALSTVRSGSAATMIAIPLVVLLLASGCSTSSDEGSDTATTTTSPGTTSTAAETTTTSATTDAEPPVPLAGTWVVVNYRMQTGSMTNALGGDAIAITFDGDGSITGSTGCNDYEGTYTVSGGYDPFEEGVPDENDGQQIAITVTSVTDNPCDEGFDAEQNADLLASLDGAERWFISRGSLILRGENAFIEATPG